MDKVRIGFIGGGGGGGIGSPHRNAISLIPGTEIVSGVLTNIDDPNQMDPMKAAKEWGIKGYTTLADMLRNAAEDGIDYIVDVTPNCFHYHHVLDCLEAGIPVLCEKPFVISPEQATRLEQLAIEKQIPAAVNYTYSGTWGEKFARELIRTEALGVIRRVTSYYYQGWLSHDENWRTNPEIAGDSCCIADIGVHCEHTIRFVTGLQIAKVFANYRSLVPGRQLDDDFDAMLKFKDSDACALITASQIAVGHRNDHGFMVSCENGTVEWRQETPDEVVVFQHKQGQRIYHRRENYNEDDLVGTFFGDLAWATALPGGHPDGLIVAMRNIHDQFIGAVKEWQENGKTQIPDHYDYPTITDGRRGVEFVSACLTSQKYDTWASISPS